nr:MAG TPA: hypothetical protein [Caudoviricetes sp.]
MVYNCFYFTIFLWKIKEAVGFCFYCLFLYLAL